jgi:hypothetical protein
MLTVWSLCWGDKYSDYHVQRLQQTVEESLTVEHQFLCVTLRSIPGVTCVPPPVDWPGWWGKLSIPGMGSDRNIWLDLDVVITGSLDFLLPYTEGPLATPWNWAQSGHGGCQSSVMAWGGKIDVAERFNPDWAHWPPVNARGVFFGDQEFITYLRDNRLLEVVQIPEPYIKSYKYHCRNGLPDDCRVVVFHGEPKPENVRESWFQW